MSVPGPENRVSVPLCAPGELDAQEQLRVAAAEREHALTEAAMARRRSRRAITSLVLAFAVVLVIVGLSAWRFIRVRATQSEELTRRALIDREIEDALANVHHRNLAVAASNDPERDATALNESYLILDRVQLQARDSNVSEERRADLTRTRAELDRIHKDLMAIAKIDRVRLDSIDFRERRIAAATLARRYGEAFASLGIETNSEQASVYSNLLRTHPNRERLLAGISAWIILETDDKKRNSLGNLIRMVEARDMYRSRLRDALFRRDDMLVNRLLKSQELTRQPPIYLCRLSVLMRNLNRENFALEVLQLGVNRHPGDFWLNAEMGGLWLHRKAVGLTPARRYFKAAVAIRPHSAGANYLLGIAAQRLGDFSESSNAFIRAIEQDPHFADAHLRLSAVLFEQNDIDGAFHHARRAADLSPVNPASLTTLAAVLLAQGRASEAVGEYRKALAADSRYVPALLGLGEILRDEGNIDDAETLLKRAADAAPDQSSVLNQYGLVLQAKGDQAGALKMFQKSKDLDPQDPSACVLLGNLRRAQGNREEALRWYQAAVERDPKCAAAFVQFGLDHQKREQHHEAIGRFQQAADSDPRSAAAHFHLGRALKHAADANASLMAFRKTVEIKPHWIEAQFLLGMTAMELSLFEEASAALQQAARLCPIGNPLFGIVHIMAERAKQGAATRFEIRHRQSDKAAHARMPPRSLCPGLLSSHV